MVIHEELISQSVLRVKIRRILGEIAVYLFSRQYMYGLRQSLVPLHPEIMDRSRYGRTILYRINDVLGGHIAGQIPRDPILDVLPERVQQKTVHDHMQVESRQ